MKKIVLIFCLFFAVHLAHAQEPDSVKTVYHFNGQHIVSLDGNKATGILYCTTYLINSEEGKRMKRSIGIHYNDEYVKIDGICLISKRTSMFDWQDLQEMDQ